jgi:two-component system chemotaxis sensor kinase CheA
MNQADLLDQFIIEARECLEQVGQRLLEVEKEPTNAELLNDLFRLVHTLKGNCGLFEFKPLERVVHAGEDLLDRVRNGTLAYNDQIADALLEAMDFTVMMVDEIELTGQIDLQADGRSTDLAARLREHLTPGKHAAPAAASASARSATADAAPDAAAAPAVVAPDWLSRIPAELIKANPKAVAWRYVPEAECFFKGEDPWLLAKQTPAIVHLDIGGQAPWSTDEGFDCYRCNFDFVALSDAPVAYVNEHFRYVPEQLTVFELAQLTPEPAATATAAPAASAADTAVSAASIAHKKLRKRAMQLWQDQLALLARPSLSTGTLSSVRTTLRGLLLAVGDEDALSAAADLLTLPGTASAVALVNWASANAPAGEVPLVALAAAAPAAQLDTSVSQTPAAPNVDYTKRSPASGGGGGYGGGSFGGGGGAAGGSAGGDEGHQKVLKVGQEKIDRLMDLIGEMVVAKNALPYLAQRAETVFQQRELAREIKAQYAVINRIAEDMQHAIMQVRMMPVGTVFQRFGRLVRDISKKLGKDVQLVVEGEETEADKNIIESLADPLIHIIRNSLDHGIEMPDVRRAAGKSPQGTIRVAARQESDRVIIEINDDGAGIDPQQVRNKAIERGLIPEDKASTLSDTDAVQLIFLPGFSTKDTISDLSGRGVGMDVVRNAVERINGHVELSSTHGRGTRLRLSLPLSMAVTNVMIIEAGDRRFGVPMDMIVETVRVHADDIHHFKQARTTVLRGRIVPLRALHDLLTLDNQPHINEDGEHAVLVVRMGGENVGLLVDHFHGASDIILKPLEGVLAGLTGFAGTALMGDGSVLMVLNPKELM